MRKNLLPIVLLLLTGTLGAQTTKIELLDLVKMLSPDSALSNTVSWPKATSKANPVKWKSPAPKKEGNNFVQRGTAAILLKGKAVQCQGMNGDAAVCKWDVILSGSKTGYTTFTVNADNLHIESDIDMIDYFFGKNKLKATLVEKDTESVMFWNYKYKLKVPGKKDIWMKITYENQTGTAAQAENNNYTDLFYIDFYTSKKEMTGQ